LAQVAHESLFEVLMHLFWDITLPSAALSQIKSEDSSTTRINNPARLRYRDPTP
jgi:hypothetical protein